MEPQFQIYIDRLKGGNVVKISGPFAPPFLEIDEPDLSFSSPVELKGEAYLSEDHLVIHLKGKTKALMPCSICNQMVEVSVEAKDYYHTEPLSEIKAAVYNFTEQVREAFLIELPKYVECSQGKCPERSTITPFMKKKEILEKEDTYFPFSNL